MTEAYDFNQTFDPVRKLQYVNSDPSVMHCHHYAVLYTQLALEFSHIGGPEMLRDSMEEAFFIVLKKAILIRGTKEKNEIKDLAEEHFRLAGLGRLELSLMREGGTALLRHSHMDEGWKSKLGTHNTPVNFIGQGYIAAAFALINGKKLRSFVVKEKRSMVSGADSSLFEIYADRGQYGHR